MLVRKAAVRCLLLLAVALCSWLTWQASEASLPPLARGIRYSADGEKVFQRRLAQSYPAGSSEADLIRELERQGFSVTRDPQLSIASLTRFGGCGPLKWMVNWKAEKDALKEIHGAYGLECF
jgi:hypothetical protein